MYIRKLLLGVMKEHVMKVLLGVRKLLGRSYLVLGRCS